MKGNITETEPTAFGFRCGGALVNFLILRKKQNQII